MSFVGSAGGGEEGGVEGVVDVGDAGDLEAGDFGEFAGVVLGEDGLGEALSRGFAQPLFDLSDGPDFACHPDFAEQDGGGVDGLLAEVRGDGDGGRQVGGGFEDTDPACDIDEDILFGQFEADG